LEGKWSPQKKTCSLPLSQRGPLKSFEKELMGLSTPTQTDQVIAKKQAAGKLKAAPEVKGEEVDEKIKELGKRAADQESRTMVRILLIKNNSLFLVGLTSRSKFCINKSYCSSHSPC